MKERILNAELQNRITDADEAARSIESGMAIAIGGYTGSGCPKAIIRKLAERKAREPEFFVNVLSSSSINSDAEAALAEAGAIHMRAPFTESRVTAGFANRQQIIYIEQQMSKMPRLYSADAFGRIDVLIIEALRITEEGCIVPTSGIGFLPLIAKKARKIIIEVNAAQPIELDGMHDIFYPGAPPNSIPIPLTHAGERIGTPYIPIDTAKVSHIVYTDIPEAEGAPVAAPEIHGKITSHLMNFLEIEVSRTGYLPPLQTGIGALAGSIIRAFGASKFNDIEFFCGALHEANIELAAKGKVKAASAGSVQMTARVRTLLKECEALRDIVVLRNGDVTNALETAARLGIVALNSAIEIDIYGNANSSHILGNRIVNGIGGGANFAQTSGLSVMLIASEGKGGDISTIVPMVPHCDINEHDIDVVITENGIADLRGKDDIDRAKTIIELCASQRYKDRLSNYLSRAIQAGGHHPCLLDEAFSWHLKLKNTGSMM